MSSADAEIASKPALPKERQEHVQQDSHDEEYESADDAYEEVEEEEVEEIEVEEEVEEEYDDDAGSQQGKEKELDDDEDRKNPQFIPKRGYFYEHDDRTKVEEEEEEEPKKEAEKKKPLPAKEPDRWSHDLFNEDDQAPKSKDELSRAYGYDIWSEEQAPRARRRRRYGRGPSKYTRQWEDEEAYQKPRGGFRGRGGRGRGNRDGGEQRGDDGYAEEFPELAPGSKPQEAQRPQGKPDASCDRRGSSGSVSHRDAGGDHRERDQGQGRQQHQRNQYHRDRDGREDTGRRYDQHDSERNGAPRGGRGGGGRGMGAGRGRGRRNEFTNRNRYRRDSNEEEYKPGPSGPSETRERPDNKPSTRGGPSGHERHERRDNRGPTTPTATNGHVHREVKPRGGPLPSKPPFTNTEYTGSGSLTAERSSNRQQHHQSVPKQSEQMEGRDGPRMGQGQGNGYPDKPRDLREVINARRMQQQQQQGNNQNDRRSQIPPRLQQQQALHHQQQQHQHLHQQQQQQQQHQQQEQQAPKPKRFSTQRQRVEQSMVTPSGGIPNSVGIPTSVPMSQGVPTMIPVVTRSEQMVPSAVPAYPQAPTYYDGSQVYETSRSPVTVATVATNGTSVSPSLWTPHGYANAPYPSPPTGPQVPQPPYADHPVYIPAPQTGPIYSAPPQFIQDPAMMNYPPTAPPFAPPYHPQGFQGYPQVTPAPPPEVYHTGGATYYSPQTQIQRQPMMNVQKRPKSVLQLVEPPEKARLDKQGREAHHHHERQVTPQAPSPQTIVVESNAESELAVKMENVKIQKPAVVQEEIKRKPSPLPPQESWSAQMEEINSPTESPENSFQRQPEPVAIESVNEELKSPTPPPSNPKPAEVLSASEEVKPVEEKAVPISAPELTESVKETQPPTEEQVKETQPPIIESVRDNMQPSAEELVKETQSPTEKSVKETQPPLTKSEETKESSVEKGSTEEVQIQSSDETPKEAEKVEEK